MQELKNKRILILQQRGWGMNIGHFLAKKLQAEGAILAAFTSKTSTNEFVRGQTEVKYEIIMNHDEIMSEPEKFLGNKKISLKEICGELGVPSVWPFVWSVRMFVRSYKDKYYYGFKKGVPDRVIINYIKGVFYNVKKMLDDFRPDLIIAPNFVGLYHIMFNLLAKKRGIKMAALTDSKVQGIYIFSHSYNDDEGVFYDRLDELNNNLAKSPNMERAKKYITACRGKLRQPYDMEYFFKITRQNLGLKQKIRHWGAPYYRILEWFIKRPKNPWKSIDISTEYRPPRIIWRDHFCHDQNKKFMETLRYEPFEKIGKFVYFPLQVQPEMTIDVLAPFFSNQIEVARLAAMSLPDDYVLVIKEHPAMVGYRPISYIRKISQLVNVKFIDYRISSEEVLKKADLVISPSSTTVAEAAFFNKPAIQLGNLGTTLKLPNVFKHSDMPTLAQKIKQVLAVDLKTVEYENKLENFVAAAYDAGVDTDYLAAWERGEKNNMELLWQAYKKEAEIALFK